MMFLARRVLVILYCWGLPIGRMDIASQSSSPPVHASRTWSESRAHATITSSSRLHTCELLHQEYESSATSKTRFSCFVQAILILNGLIGFLVIVVIGTICYKKRNVSDPLEAETMARQITLALRAFSTTSPLTPAPRCQLWVLFAASRRARGHPVVSPTRYSATWPTGIVSPNSPPTSHLSLETVSPNQRPFHTVSRLLRATSRCSCWRRPRPLLTLQPSFLRLPLQLLYCVICPRIGPLSCLRMSW